MATEMQKAAEAVSTARRLRAEVGALRQATADARTTLRASRLRAIRLRYAVRLARRDRLGTVLCMAMPPPKGGDDGEAQVDDLQAIVAALMSKVAGLEEALESRDAIGQAKGILMERFGVDADAAFEWLHASSQKRNEKIRVLAEKLACTGEWPDE